MAEPCPVQGFIAVIIFSKSRWPISTTGSVKLGCKKKNIYI